MPSGISPPRSGWVGMPPTATTQETASVPMGPEQCGVLLRLDNLYEARVSMPPNMGEWRKVPGRSRVRRWSFHPSAEGRETSGWLIAVSDAANQALAVYGADKGTRSNCLPGVYRDGFSSGVQWAQWQAEVERLEGDATDRRQRADADVEVALVRQLAAERAEDNMFAVRDDGTGETP